MGIVIGAPNTIKGTTGSQLLEWASVPRQPALEPEHHRGRLVPGLRGADVPRGRGAVTERIRFMSNVMIAPARSTAELERDVMGGWTPCASTSSSTTPR